MHEVSAMSEMFEIINQNIESYGLKKVNKVVVKIGESSCIHESSIKFSFETMAKGTICENAQIIIEKVKGHELLLDSIEGE